MHCKKHSRECNASGATTGGDAAQPLVFANEIFTLCYECVKHSACLSLATWAKAIQWTALTTQGAAPAPPQQRRAETIPGDPMATDILLEAGTNELEIVECYITTEGYKGYYGINVAKVLEILQCQKTTTMPEMQHPAIKGIFAHRTGRVVPILDMSVYFGGPPLQEEGSKLIVTEFNRTVTSFLVSGVTRIHRLSWTQVETPDKITQSAKRNCITAVVRLEDRITFILDLEGIVAELYPALAIHYDAQDTDDGDITTPLRVLHVDDSDIIRQIVHRLMGQDRRFQLVQAINGQEALDMLTDMRDKGHIPFDAVITDIEMPRMDGMTLCRKIKEDGILRDIPVAIFSSLVNDELVAKCKSVGADAQYNKPDLTEICKRVVDLVAAKRSAA